jgi:glycerate-2-kinase
MTSVRLSRAVAEAVLRDAIAGCDPRRRVGEALGAPPFVDLWAGRRRLALAVGKAALAMARGAGEVAEGIAVVPAGGAGALPPASRSVRWSTEQASATRCSR